MDAGLTATAIAKWTWWPRQRYLLDGRAHRLGDGEQPPEGAVPDLSDPTTEACLRLIVLRRGLQNGATHIEPTDLSSYISCLHWMP